MREAQVALAALFYALAGYGREVMGCREYTEYTCIFQEDRPSRMSRTFLHSSVALLSSASAAFPFPSAYSRSPTMSFRLILTLHTAPNTAVSRHLAPTYTCKQKFVS